MKVVEFSYRSLTANPSIVLPRELLDSVQGTLAAKCGCSKDNHQTFYVSDMEDWCCFYNDTPSHTKGVFLTFHDMSVNIGSTARRYDCWHEDHETLLQKYGLEDLIE